MGSAHRRHDAAPNRVVGFCESGVNVLAQVACLRLRSLAKNKSAELPFCLRKKRPISCHSQNGKSVFLFFSFCILPGKVARLDATFPSKRGIGEGLFQQAKNRPRRLLGRKVGDIHLPGGQLPVQRQPRKAALHNIRLAQTGVDVPLQPLAQRLRAD